MTYNHGRFRMSDYDLTQFPGPNVGEPAPLTSGSPVWMANRCISRFTGDVGWL